MTRRAAAAVLAVIVLAALIAVGLARSGSAEGPPPSGWSAVLFLLATGAAEAANSAAGEPLPASAGTSAGEATGGGQP